MSEQPFTATLTQTVMDEAGSPLFDITCVVTEDVERGSVLLVGPPVKKGDPPMVAKITNLTSDP